MYTSRPKESSPPPGVDLRKQLYLAVIVVFDAWDCPRARKYRSISQIKGLKGTVGEDVVAGIRTPQHIDAMKECVPKAYDELVENCEILERHYKDMMDTEFTVQENRLWMLQGRVGKRTGRGAIRIAVNMVKEGLVDTRSTIKMVEPGHVDQLLHPQFEDPSAYKDKVIGTGLPASPGAAVGQIVFTTEDVEAWHAQGKAVILVRTETSPDDISGMHAAEGILIARGGMTSHAAVVARGWGKCCISGCSDIRVNDSNKVVVVGGNVFKEGEWLSLNGTTGKVILGKKSLSPPVLSGDLATFMSWVDEIRQLKVMANADTPDDALTARNNGAQGIGLCRTEHMRVIVRDMVSETGAKEDKVYARVENLSEVNPMLSFRGCRKGRKLGLQAGYAEKGPVHEDCCTS
ncbi:hypothetical protein ZIOFF_018016 [Zingiber officinale]|uniref:pyruvate, phosphate dikinase n=1 Tax=Zingiber officinale TaxID=94328 RepID=A0A8J5LIK8_ZINOF|nr:hypothetical protein ZIOFF_018016 [Zingiber officinale]